MSEQACPRCGHQVQHPISPIERARRATGRKPARKRCDAEVERGFNCPCQSRWHVGASA